MPSAVPLVNRCGRHGGLNRLSRSRRSTASGSLPAGDRTSTCKPRSELDVARRVRQRVQPAPGVDHRDVRPNAWACPDPRDEASSDDLHAPLRQPTGFTEPDSSTTQRDRQLHSGGERPRRSATRCSASPRHDGRPRWTSRNALVRRRAFPQQNGQLADQHDDRVARPAANHRATAPPRSAQLEQPEVTRPERAHVGHTTR